MTSWEELVDVAEMHLPHILGIIAIIVSNVISVIIVNIVIIVSIVSSLQKTLSPIEDTPPHQNIDWKRSRKGKQVGGQEMEMPLPEITKQKRKRRQITKEKTEKATNNKTEKAENNKTEKVINNKSQK